VAATATEARGLYVYGVTLADVQCEGRTVDVGRLRAVVSEEPLAQYEPEAVEAALRAPGWLEQRLRAHEAVLESVLAAGPVAPFRFGTIFRTEQELRAALSRAEQDLAERLDELRGAAEWGVKAWVDDGVLFRWLEEHDDRTRQERSALDDATETGRRYLLEKRLRRRLESDASELALDRAHAAHASLAATAREASAERPSGLDERAGKRPVLRASYLVAGDGLAAFQRAVAAARERDAELGLEYVLSGPWPPYSFVDAQLA